jgi:hypothetical protein
MSSQVGSMSGPHEEILRALKQKYLLGRTPVLPRVPSGSSSTPLYELQLSRPLPAVDISNTLAMRLLSKDSYIRLLNFMRMRFHYVSNLYRVLSIGYFGLLVLADADVRTALTVAYLGSIMPLICIIGFLSLEIIALLVYNYEFWFMSVVNAIQFTALAGIFGDMRALTCIATWLSVQTIITIDANYRTFPMATKSVLIGIPSITAIGVCCSLHQIAGSKHVCVTIKGVPVVATDIVLFTTSTLVLFLLKKVYYKHARKHTTPVGFHEVPCVVLRSRLRLVPTNGRQRRNGLTITEGSEFTRIRRQTVSNTIQKLRLSKAPIFIVDARRTLVLNAIESKLLSSQRWSRWSLWVLYTFGALGTTMPIVAWLLLILSPDSEWWILASNTVATVASIVFTGCFACLWQRDVIIALLFNFDFMFSLFQIYALTICLCAMVRWQPDMCLPVVIWWLWFHWVLMLDALTPLAKQRLAFKKKYATGIMVLLLVCAFMSAMAMFFAPDDAVMDNLVLWHIEFSTNPSVVFEIHASTFAIQRIVSIIGWSTRLPFELARRHEDELLFVQGLIEYESPYETFPVQSQLRRSAIFPSLSRRH